MIARLLSTLLDRWTGELPEVSGTVGKVVRLERRSEGGEPEPVQSLELSPAKGVVGDPRGPRVNVVREVAISALLGARASATSDLLGTGDHVFLELGVDGGSLPRGSALTIGSVILGVDGETHDPDREFVAAFGGGAARRVRRQNRAAGPARRLRCRVLQPGTVQVGDRVYAKAVGIRFQP